MLLRSPIHKYLHHNCGSILIKIVPTCCYICAFDNLNLFALLVTGPQQILQFSKDNRQQKFQEKTPLEIQKKTSKKDGQKHSTCKPE